jgi:hypothetical protein
MGSSEHPANNPEENSLQLLPWWKNGRIITVLGSILAAVMPVTTFVGGYLHQQTELELNAQQQRHQIRMDYLDRALNPKLAEAEREKVFSLLAVVTDQPDLQKWAIEQQKSLSLEINNLTAQLEAKKIKEDELADKLQKSQEAIAELRRLQREKPEKAEEINKKLLAAKIDAVKIDSSMQQVEQNVAQLSQRIGAPVVSESARSTRLKRATQKEREAFESLLSGEYDRAIEAFEETEIIYPTFHQVYEIGRLLRRNRSKLDIPDERRKIFIEIAQKHSYGAPRDLLFEIRKQAGLS